MRVTRKIIGRLIERANDRLTELGKDWHLVYWGAYGHSDVKKQQNGESTIRNITPDAVSTKRELYIWLRGFLHGLYEH